MTEISMTYQKRLDTSGYLGLARYHLPPAGIGIFARAGCFWVLFCSDSGWFHGV